MARLRRSRTDTLSCGTTQSAPPLKTTPPHTPLSTPSRLPSPSTFRLSRRCVFVDRDLLPSTTLRQPTPDVGRSSELLDFRGIAPRHQTRIVYSLEAGLVLDYAAFWHHNPPSAQPFQINRRRRYITRVLTALPSDHAGTRATVRRSDGAVVTYAASPYHAMVERFVGAAAWESALRLCRYVKSHQLWACLAAMAVAGKELHTVRPPPPPRRARAYTRW